MAKYNNLDMCSTAHALNLRQPVVSFWQQADPFAANGIILPILPKSARVAGEKYDASQGVGW